MKIVIISLLLYFMHKNKSFWTICRRTLDSSFVVHFTIDYDQSFCNSVALDRDYSISISYIRRSNVTNSFYDVSTTTQQNYFNIAYATICNHFLWFSLRSVHSYFFYFFFFSFLLLLHAFNLRLTYFILLLWLFLLRIEITW